MSQKIKEGDLIIAYHGGFHRVTKLYSYNYEGRDVPQVEYDKKFNENGTISKTQKKSCHLNYCKLAIDFIPEKIKELEKTIKNLQKIYDEENEPKD